MKLGLINSAFAQAGKGTRFGLEKTKEIGFDSVDIFTDPLDIDIRERRLIRTTAEELGFRRDVEGALLPPTQRASAKRLENTRAFH